MKILGLVMALAGWFIPVAALTFTQSLAARFVIVVLGIVVILAGILGVLNKSHLKHAIWKL